MTAQRQLAIATRGFRTLETSTNQVAIATRGFRLPGIIVVEDGSFIITQALELEYSASNSFDIILAHPQHLEIINDIPSFVMDTVAAMELHVTYGFNEQVAETAPQQVLVDLGETFEIPDALSYQEMKLDTAEFIEMEIIMDKYIDLGTFEQDTCAMSLDSSYNVVGVSYKSEGMVVESDALPSFTIDLEDTQDITVSLLVES